MTEPNATLTAVPGVAVGHWTDLEGATGCTVVLFDPAAVAGVDVRGSAPGTRETDALAVTGAVTTADSILLTGGSAFGLAAADGVMQWLEEHGRGYPTPAGPVPIVPAAVIFDLMLGSAASRPDARAGYLAAEAAGSAPVATGNVGAGTGAVVGHKRRGTKGGLGSALMRRRAVVVGALAVVNPVGNVHDPVSGRAIAGTRAPAGGIAPYAGQVEAGHNTMLGVVATNALLERPQVTKVAQMAHDGIARVIRPAHTASDGDTVFAASVPAAPVETDVTLVGHLASLALERAVLSGVRDAAATFGLPSSADLEADGA